MEMSKIKHAFASIFATLLAVHYAWREVAEIFHVITKPVVTSADAGSHSLPLHLELAGPAPVALDDSVSDSSAWPPPWLRAPTTEWPVQRPPLALWIGDQGL